MNNDLISREALKKVLCEEYEAREHYIGEIMLKAIDNAPTVAYPFEKFRTMLCGTCQAYMRIEPERPQGKWIFHKDYNESCRYGCNQCGNLNNIPSNFCPNCGAGMRKGGVE